MIYASLFSRYPIRYCHSFTQGAGCSVFEDTNWASVFSGWIELDEYDGVQSRSFAFALMSSEWMSRA
jgi:hypothetical protein